MSQKTFFSFILLLPILLLVFSLPMMAPLWFPAVKASPGVIYVPDNYDTIQEAVYAAGFGDTIIVRADIYDENLIINQTVTLIGENKFTTIIEGEGTDNVVTFSNISITMCGFTVRNGNNFSGIEVNHFGDHMIFDNILSDNAFGVNLLITSGNTVVDNTLIDNSIAGINVISSNTNNFSNNQISQSEFGIKLEDSDDNSVVNNIVSEVAYGVYVYSSNFVNVDRNKVSGQSVGIYSAYSSDNSIRHNTVFKCDQGIELYGTTRNIVLNNTAIQNAYGIYAVYSNADNEVDSNLVSNNKWGIRFYDSDNNIVVYNVASYNTHGIWLATSSTGNSIYKNNFLENNVQVTQYGDSPNTWYTQIAGKKYGNYWSDYRGNDTDGDGVGDSPSSSIPHAGVDDYPLMNSTMVVHDVAIVSVVTSDSSVYEGDVVNITVVARNEGTVSETFNVTAKYFNRIIGTETVPNLTRYESTTLVFNWNTTDIPTGFNYEIRAEASPVSGETDTADNIFDDGTIAVEEPRIPGDVNGDGTVDASDLFYLSKVYGSKLGDPNWDQYCDLNGDGKVDSSDLSDLRENYGNTS